MAKQQRVNLNLRAAPADAEHFKQRAQSEGRSFGELFAVMLRDLEAARPVSRETTTQTASAEVS